MNPKFQAALDNVIEFFSAPKPSKEDLAAAQALAEDTARRVREAAAKAQVEAEAAKPPARKPRKAAAKK